MFHKIAKKNAFYLRMNAQHGIGSRLKKYFFLEISCYPQFPQNEYTNPEGRGWSCMLELPAERARVSNPVVPGQGVFSVVSLYAETVDRAPRIDRAFSKVTDEVTCSSNTVGNPGSTNDGW